MRPCRQTPVRRRVQSTAADQQRTSVPTTYCMTVKSPASATSLTAQSELPMRFLFIFAALAFLSSAANSATVETTIEECWKGNDHGGMSKCVASRASRARDNLQTTEQAMRVTISKSQEVASYLVPVRQRFESSVTSYRKYKDKQCSFREALASMGNGSAEIKLACEAELDSSRTEQLKLGMGWLV